VRCLPSNVRDVWRSVWTQLKEEKELMLDVVDRTLSALEPFKEEKIIFKAKTIGKSGTTGSPDRAVTCNKSSSSSKK